MNETQEIYLIDSNSFMTPFRFYYAFDLVLTYWEKIRQYFEEGRMVVLDMVQKEIETGEDELAVWLREIDNLTVIRHVKPDIIQKYQEVMQYIEECGLYKQSAVNAWAPSSVADPWLIATAAVNGFTLITVSSMTLNIKQPNKTAKIPDVVKEFGVKTANVFYMMRMLNERNEEVQGCAGCGGDLHICF